jgi:ADP-ribosylation factor GTPase-activating protein 1
MFNFPIDEQMKEGGYDQKVNETVNVVATKTAEIGSRTWGIMKGVMAMATQKVEEFSKEGTISRKSDEWPRSENEQNGYYQQFNRETNGGYSNESNSTKNYTSAGSSWDDWGDDGRETKVADTRDTRGSQASHDDWAGWDDAKDDGYDSYNHAPAATRGSSHGGKSEWTEGGFL